ncbi:MAG: 2-hydroxymuconate tautomerase [Geminicoccaceae bacterium]
MIFNARKERNMPVIRVEMFEGRTKEQKRALAKELTAAFVNTAGGAPEQVHIVMTDVAKDDWAVAGKLSSDG